LATVFITDAAAREPLGLDAQDFAQDLVPVLEGTSHGVVQVVTNLERGLCERTGEGMGGNGRKWEDGNMGDRKPIWYLRTGDCFFL